LEEEVGADESKARCIAVAVAGRKRRQNNIKYFFFKKKNVITETQQ
jgi:hypothetical protein